MVAVSTSADPLAPQDAIDYFRGKVQISDDEWQKLSDRNNDSSFRMAGVTDLDVIEHVWTALDKAISQGTDFRKFKEDISQSIGEAWSPSGWRLETIFRTNVQSAYQRGNYEQAQQTKEDRPYGMLDVIEDEATSDICGDLDDLIGGRAISLDDPIWATAWPPNHYNCRSTVITLSEQEAREQGILEEPPDVEVDPDFDRAPNGPSAGLPDPEEYPAELQKEVERIIEAKPEESRVTPNDMFSFSESKPDDEKYVESIISSLSTFELSVMKWLPDKPKFKSVASDIEGHPDSFGVYYPRSGDLVVSRYKVDKKTEDFIPGKSWSYYYDRSTLKAANASTVTHEYGHHLSMGFFGPPGSYERRFAIMYRYYQKAMATVNGPISEYARTDHYEYFAESWACYAKDKAMLLRHDPIGYEMVEEVLKEIGYVA